ncbi:MAG: hypothetical protein KAU20_08005 [Nanoarchaeota archaeon]|nr:hypothetical protein [Nanoarchaeota archaeon]
MSPNGQTAKEQDWNTRRKKIWKGKIAPPGKIFIVIKTKKGNTGCLLINGGQGTDAEMAVQKYLREEISKKFNDKC